MAASAWAPGANTINVDAESSNLSQVFTSTLGQTLFSLTKFTYVPESGALAVYRNGQRLVLDSDWEETSTSSFTLLITGIAAGEVIEAVAVIGATAANVLAAEQYKDDAEAAALNAANSAAEAAVNAAAVDFTKDSVTTFTNKTLEAGDGNSVEATSGPDGSQLAGFRNRIINGDMRIAQRGTSIQVGGSDTYTLDRWRAIAAGANFTVNQGSIAINGINKKVLVGTGASGNTLADVFQRIEGVNVADLGGKVCKVSFLTLTTDSRNITWEAYYANTQDTFSAKTLIASGAIATASNYGKREFQFTAPIQVSQGLEIRLKYGAAGAGVQFGLTNVQLEEGSIATPFEQRPIGLELSLCQRYYSTTRGYGIGYGTVGSLYAVSTPLPVPMRTASPVITLVGGGSSSNIGSVATIALTQSLISVYGTISGTGAVALSEPITASAEL